MQAWAVVYIEEPGTRQWELLLQTVQSPVFRLSDWKGVGTHLVCLVL